jgi:fermentation-respiration switch protein FrsA (DUF1100 family)
MRLLLVIFSILFTYNANSAPLVVALHGYGMNPQWMRELIGQVEKEFPEAGYFYMTSSPEVTWNTGKHKADFDKLVTWSKPFFNKVFVIGYSAGGFFGNQLKTDAFVQIAAGGTNQAPTLIIHGRSDQTVGYGSGVQSLRSRPGCENVTPEDGCHDYPQCNASFCSWAGNHHFPPELAKDVAKFLRKQL